MRHPSGDPKRSRVFVILSRQELIDSRYGTVVCAPVFSTRSGLATQVDVGVTDGLKHTSCIQCDGLTSVRKADLTHYVGSLSAPKLRELTESLRVALAVEC